MAKFSAGILIFRNQNGLVEVLLAHPGGPFYAKKDSGVWSIPKGEYDEGEEALDAAKREFEEEIGQLPPEGGYVDIGEAKLSNKTIKAWAVEDDIDVSNVKSNTFEMEWPPRSGKKQEFPEIDRAEWLSFGLALEKINSGQVIFLERLAEKLGIEKLETEVPAQQQLL